MRQICNKPRFGALCTEKVQKMLDYDMVSQRC